MILELVSLLIPIFDLGLRLRPVLSSQFLVVKPNFRVSFLRDLLMYSSLYGLWVEAVEEPPGVPEAWHEGKGENDPARMQLLCL